VKAVVYYGGTDLRYEELPTPSSEANEVLVKVSYAGVCGSDVTIYTGKHKRVKPPRIIGHEASGVVAEVGSAVTDFAVGDRVVIEPPIGCGECYACRLGAFNACKNLGHLGIDVHGMFAEYVKARGDKVYLVPESTTQLKAALIEPTAVGAHAVRMGRVALGDKVVVLGGGPIGILTAQVARVASSLPVQVVEVADWRLDFARGLGFDPIDAKKGNVLEEVLARTGGKGADVVIDTAGVATTAQQAPALARIRGVVAMVAMPDEPLPIDVNPYVLKEVSLVGSRAYDSHDYETTIALIGQDKVDVEPLVTQVMPLENWREALELAKKPDASMKILLRP